MPKTINLERFVEAQDPVYTSVLSELRRGRKTSHWMWFIFPQIKGLGHSPNADYYGISGRSEAEAYLAHSILGPRLVECTTLVNHAEGRTLEAIFGGIDALKFRSSMTLFSAVAQSPNVFTAALAKYCGGAADSLTLRLLKGN